jgi:hypothetical protein
VPVASEDGDGDGVLDEGEDLNDNGVLDTGVGADPDDERFLTEDTDGDGVLDDGEDANGNGVLDQGLDVNGDGTLDEGEIDVVAVAEVEPAPAIWKAEGEVDAAFDDLFGSPEIVAVHQSAEDYETIIACGELTAANWEDEDEVVIALRPVDGSGYYGYAVFQRDTGNVPVFGENTTGVTVYLFENLTTQRQERMATPATGGAAETPATTVAETGEAIGTALATALIPTATVEGD